jgi:hypothetical protein
MKHSVECTCATVNLKFVKHPKQHTNTQHIILPVIPGYLNSACIEGLEGCKLGSMGSDSTLHCDFSKGSEFFGVSDLALNSNSTSGTVAFH